VTFRAFFVRVTYYDETIDRHGQQQTFFMCSRHRLVTFNSSNMENQIELPDELTNAISSWCAKGDALAEARRLKEALIAFNEAWKLIPDPKNDWDAATWVLAAIGDTAYLSGDYANARKALEYGMSCPGAVGNPFMHLRFGQVLYESNEFDRSADELMRSYMGAGLDVFASEDPKYLSFLKSRAQL
jgi:tetratricopeptide (TPR) repeat protein